jgi:putative inorganic carbon (hco3(-)) transporter
MLILRRLAPAVLAITHAISPLFPSFIALTSIAFPGVSLLPRWGLLAVLACAVSAAAYCLVLPLWYRERGSAPLLLPVIALYASALLSAFLGFDPAAGLLFIGIFALSGLWHFGIMRFYGDPNVAIAIYWAYMLSGMLAAAAAVIMVVARAPAALYTIGHGRAIGTFILPGELAAYLVIFLPIAYAVTRVGPSPGLRAVAWIGGAIGLVALALTYSRAGWMGFAAAVAFIVAAQTRRLRHGATAAAVVIGLGVAAVLLLFNAHHNPSEDYTRISIWQAAIAIIDRFPLTGVGPFDFSRLYAVVRSPDGDATAFHAHSIYLTFFAEMGIVGLAAFGWVLWSFVASLRERLRNAQPQASLLALAAAAGLAGVAVQGLIDTMSIVIFGLWMPTMALALSAAKYGFGERA